MRLSPALWSSPVAHLKAEAPDQPMLYFAPATLQATAARFLAGFPGLVTYAVKANDADVVLENLAQAGLTAFDVASPYEMEKVRRVLPSAVLHYNNPVRSVAEIEIAARLGVASYSVDSLSELRKLAGRVPEGSEVSVRLKLPVKGAAYDFGAKFGASPEQCEVLLAEVVALGFTPSMTFHPGTQCTDAGAWGLYIREAAGVADRAGVRLARLNVGGGFPSHRGGVAPDLEAIFAAIEAETDRAFGDARPALVCEPGRAMVAESFTLGARIKSIRDGGAVFLNDGIYGGLAEAVILGSVERLIVVNEAGRARTGAPVGKVVFGPTCDSLDRLPGEVLLPADADEGDWILFQGMGAYSTATVTRFNGYGEIGIATVAVA